MPRMTGGEAVVRSLSTYNVSTVFGIPGAHNLAIYDALLDATDIKHIVARHEQSAAFMADGYARISGLAGICICTTGTCCPQHPCIARNSTQRLIPCTLHCQPDSGCRDWLE